MSGNYFPSDQQRGPCSFPHVLTLQPYMFCLDCYLQAAATEMAWDIVSYIVNTMETGEAGPYQSVLERVRDATWSSNGPEVRFRLCRPGSACRLARLVPLGMS